MSDDTVYILDSYGLIFRCYFAFINRPILNPKGENISALSGFFRNFHYVLEHYKPSCVIAAMDSKTKTFRHEMYSEYKATRNKTPEDLHAQIPWITETLEALGIPVLQCDGYEADDIIATVASKCAEKGRSCRILSADKDLMQLVNDTTSILKPENGGGWKICNSDAVFTEWGVKPAQLLDLLSLYGDTADNIPGVHGVGVKTAAKLLGEYNDLDGIYAHISEIKGAMQTKLADGKENAYFSQKLVRLCSEVPVENLDEILSKPVQLNPEKAAEILKKYGALMAAKSYAASSVEENGKVSAKTEKTAESGNKAEKLSSALPETENTEESGEDSAFVEPVQNHGEYKAVTTEEELSAFIQKAVKAGTVAYDSETDSLDAVTGHIVGFSLSYEKGKGIYVPLVSTNIFESSDFIPLEKALELLKTLFLNPDVTIVFHNGKFDYKFLRSSGLSFENEEIKCHMADTMIAAWLLSPDRLGKNSYSLEYLSEQKLHLKGIEYDEIVPKGQIFSDIELSKAVPYAAEDADFTLQLWNVLKPELEKASLCTLFTDMEMKVLPVLAEMELYGIHLDKNALYSYNTELTEGIKNAEKDIYAEVGHEFNIASPKQLQTVLFEERGLKPGKKTKTGYSTDTTVLEELAMYDSVPKKILEYRELAKLQSTYVETLPELADKNSRIHTEFVQTGTATGRLSSRDPNLQNIPVRSDAGRKIRSAFTAPEGKVLISADYAQIELVVLAHLSGDPKMCEAFLNGTDVHKATAALIYGVPAEQVTPEMRRTAKTINFGVIYGMSAFRLAGDLGISRTQAKDFIESYFALYSSINSFISSTIADAEKNGYVTTMSGRRRYILNINSRNKLEKSGAERMAVNTPVQGTAADIVKKAMISVNEALKEKNNGAKLLLQVHDELILECPDDEKTISETIALVKEKMENAVKLSIPLRVSVEWGKSWGEFH